MKAIVSITFDDAFVVHDVKVVEGNNGYLWPCLVAKMPDENFGISPIPFLLRHGNNSNRCFKAYEEAI